MTDAMISKKDIHGGVEITSPQDKWRRFVAVVLDEEEFEEAKNDFMKANPESAKSVKELTIADIIDDYHDQLLQRSGGWHETIYDILDAQSYEEDDN